MSLLKKQSFWGLVTLMLVCSCAPFSTRFVDNVTYKSVVDLPVGSPYKNVAYGDNALQFAELWLPDTGSRALEKRALPVVVFVHGGCWLNAYDIAHSRAMSNALAREGFAVWSLEYRRTGDVGGAWPGTFEDVLSGIRYLREIDEVQLDYGNISIVGHSAGGHLALLAGANEPTLKVRFSRVIGLAAIYDLVAYSKGSNSCQKAAISFMGGGAEEKIESYLAADASRMNLHAKTLLLHGDQDAIVPVNQTVDSGQKYKIVEGAGHFDFLHPSSRAWDVLLKELKAK